MSIEKFFCSFSGGKDSILALYLAKEKGVVVKELFTITNEKGLLPEHQIPLKLIELQGRSLGVKVSSFRNQNPEQSFLEGISYYERKKFSGGIFGDVINPEHQAWIDSAMADKALRPLYFLGESGSSNARDFVDLGFKALITSVDKKRVSTKYIGQVLTHQVIDCLEKEGVNPSGESNAYHTLVIDGPLFKEPLAYTPVKIYQNEEVAYIIYE